MTIKQVGGNHYEGAEYQHWDWVIENKIPYLQGNATRYLCRWRKKNGVEDLEKAKTYFEKIIESNSFFRGSYTDEHQIDIDTSRFIMSNDIQQPEKWMIELCVVARLDFEIERIIDSLDHLISELRQEDTNLSPAQRIMKRDMTEQQHPFGWVEGDD